MLCLNTLIYLTATYVASLLRRRRIWDSNQACFPTEFADFGLRNFVFFFHANISVNTTFLQNLGWNVRSFIYVLIKFLQIDWLARSRRDLWKYLADSAVG